MTNEPPRYVIPLREQPPKRRNTFWSSVRRLLILYAGAYVLCFGMEGVMRLTYHVGSLTEIEKRISDRGQRAKAIVARQKLIDAMTVDPLYDVYVCVVFFGTPILTILLLVHDVRFINHTMRRVWLPFRWLVIGFFAMTCSGFLILLGPFVGAERFYDRNSPAELIAKFR